MFKALLLKSWYTLSDPALEKQLSCDLLFCRFIGLSIPDHSPLWRLRQLLEKKFDGYFILKGINATTCRAGFIY
jgi:IS5 family transposase